MRLRGRETVRWDLRWLAGAAGLARMNKMNKCAGSGRDARVPGVVGAVAGSDGEVRAFVCGGDWGELRGIKVNWGGLGLRATGEPGEGGRKEAQGGEKMGGEGMKGRIAGGTSALRGNGSTLRI